jgi:putative nucleotidyltransferase with HDIG domain
MPVPPHPKKKVLFVDDETMLLDLYRFAFDEEGSEWDVSTAPSGREALAFLETTPIDVLVSDMRMPGMTGAELVQEVMKRHPHTSRLIMSGFADSQQIAQCLGATHQFIAKPFELGNLRSTIDRVCALDHWLLDDRLKSLVAQLPSLPSLPSLYFQIMEALASPDSSLEQIGSIIAADPSMTAKILQLVNSAFFGIARRISNPTEAVQILGVGRVRSLVLSLHIFTCFEGVRLKNFSIDKVWRHSMSTALVAQKIARQQKVDTAIADETYVAGMLHDIGKVMLAASLPEQYGKTVELAASEQITLVEAERATFGVSHAQIAAYLLGLWGLPIPIVEAVAFHHDPARAAAKTFTPLTAVHVASTLEHHHQPGPIDPFGPQLDLPYLAEIGCPDRVEPWTKLAHLVLSDVG